MRNRSKFKTQFYAAAFTVVVLLAGGTQAAVAQPLVAPQSPNAIEGSDAVFYEVKLPQTMRLTDALETKHYYGHPVQAYRFENPQIVGEFAVNGAETAEEFLRGFQEQFGTEPMVVSAMINIPADQLEAIAEQAATSRTIAPRSAGFVAPPVDTERTADLLAARQADSVPEATTMRAPAEWTPTYAEVEVYREGTNKVKFVQYYSWNGVTTSTKALNKTYGMEFEVNITTANASYQGAKRPVNCPADYKKRPFAQNTGWTWSVFMNVGNGLVNAPTSVGAYPDYNDLLDTCNKNSIAIGFRHPQSLPSGPTGTQDVLVTIVAPRGLDNTGKISGGVQTITKTWCDDFPLLQNTDCMGVAAGTAGYRLTLNANRNWVAPNKCWTSGNRGIAVPVTYACP